VLIEDEQDDERIQKSLIEIRLAESFVDGSRSACGSLVVGHRVVLGEDSTPSGPPKNGSLSNLS